MKTETLFSKNSDEWQTPLEFFQDLDREFHFDLDACATHENHMVDTYFTKDEDGLEQNWGGQHRLVQSPIQPDKEVGA